jgi:hypothetical protein
MVLMVLLNVLSIVLCLAIGFCVLGLMVGRLFRWRWVLRQGLGLNAVLGLAASLLFLEVWNFFLPVSHASVVVLGVAILTAAILFRRTLVEVGRSWAQKFSVPSTLLLLVVLITVSLFGSGPSEHGHYDTGLYYLNSIRWTHEYPVVPGLGNLHGRLAYNQSTFLLIAFLSSLANMGVARACQVVNPLFVFISAWAVLDQVKINLTTERAKRVRLYAFLLIGPLFLLGKHTNLSAPAADLAAASLALPGALAFFCCLEEIVDRNGFNATQWLLLLVICDCTIARLKLSYAVLGVTAIGLAAIGLIFLRLRSFIWVWIRIGVLAAVLVVPWALRGVVLSGFPLYPSTLIRFRTDWAVSRKSADDDRLSIYSRARMPDKTPDEVLRNDAWFGSWVARNAKEPENVFLFVFVTAGALAWLLSFFTPMQRRRRITTVLLFIQTGSALLFWFKTAPDPLSGYASILLFGVGGFNSCATALAGFSQIRSSLFACLVVLPSIWSVFGNEWPLIYHAAKRFPQGFPTAELEYKVTDSGLRVGVPKGEQAWNTGLVVTPYFNPNLTLRGPDLREGFRIR